MTKSELKAELVKATETAKVTSVTQRQHIERLQNELNELKEENRKLKKHNEILRSQNRKKL